jgi:periplasmic protein TonB
MPAGRHAAIFSLIVLLHIGFFYAMQAGLLREASRVIEQEVVARLIEPEAPPPPEPPPPPPPKVVIAPPPPPPPPTATIKPVDTPPPPTAITLPPAPPEPPPKPAEPAPVVVAPGPPAPPAPPPPVVAPPQPPAPPAEPRVVTFGDGAVAYVKEPNISYPQISMRLRETGTVLLRLWVSEEGLVERAEIAVSSGYPRLDKAAREGVMRAQFRPILVGGRGIKFQIDKAPYAFKLDQ